MAVVPPTPTEWQVRAPQRPLSAHLLAGELSFYHPVLCGSVTPSQNLPAKPRLCLQG